LRLAPNSGADKIRFIIKPEFRRREIRVCSSWPFHFHLFSPASLALDGGGAQTPGGRTVAGGERVAAWICRLRQTRGLGGYGEAFFRLGAALTAGLGHRGLTEAGGAFAGLLRALAGEREEAAPFQTGDLAEHQAQPEQAAKQEEHRTPFRGNFTKSSSDASRLNQKHRSNAGARFKQFLTRPGRFSNKAETIKRH
jgi:hypothetical protein